VAGAAGWTGELKYGREVEPTHEGGEILDDADVLFFGTQNERAVAGEDTE
jgi:hypothetical protein